MTLMALRVVDRRVRETVTLPRFAVEEQLVDIQAASIEAHRWLDRAYRLIGDEHLPEGLNAVAAADTLIQLVNTNAHDLAGEVTRCPTGLLGPDGSHAA